MRRLKLFFLLVWELVLEPFWLLITWPFEEDPQTAEACFKIQDFALDTSISGVPCLEAKVVWADGEVWPVISMDGRAWHREPDGREIQDPVRAALEQFYAACCEITTYTVEGR